jgi:hypothetical protein
MSTNVNILPGPMLTEWEYQLVDVPTQPYRLPTDPPDADMHTAADLLNTWGRTGWQFCGVIAPWQVLLCRPKAQFTAQPYVPSPPSLTAPGTIHVTPPLTGSTKP